MAHLSLCIPLFRVLIVFWGLGRTINCRESQISALVTVKRVIVERRVAETCLSCLNVHPSLDMWHPEKMTNCTAEGDACGERFFSLGCSEKANFASTAHWDSQNHFQSKEQTKKQINVGLTVVSSSLYFEKPKYPRMRKRWLSNVETCFLIHAWVLK